MLFTILLQDEKRFYQLELVNRETNFNKVFNTAPNVGVLNPLAAPTKVDNHDFFFTSESDFYCSILHVFINGMLSSKKATELRS